MPQSLAKIYLHLVFSTKYRERNIRDEFVPSVHAYMGGILNDIGCRPIKINTEPDHAHVLFEFGRTVTVARTVGELKKGTTIWMNERYFLQGNFLWQRGYGVFSVSESNVPMVIRYIENQKEHHRGIGYKDEFRALCRRHGVKYDERYVWD